MKDFITPRPKGLPHNTQKIIPYSQNKTNRATANLENDI